MFGDPWPEEPDDPFPESLDPFPEYREPVRPELSIQPREQPADESVPPAVQNGMVALLGVVRIGLFALALGPLLLFLGGEPYYGKLITGMGVVTSLYAGHRYLVYRDLARTRRE